MTFYELSVLTNTGYPYYHLNLKKPPQGVNLYLRFFDFSSNSKSKNVIADPNSLFELNAGLVSALYEFAKNIDKKIETIEFSSEKKDPPIKYRGDVLITTQTETYLLQNSIKAKIKLIYDTIIAPKIPLVTALEILQNEEDQILEILIDSEARSRVMNHKNKLDQLTHSFFSEMKNYGLLSICITSFDLSPIMVFGETFDLNDIDSILRNIDVFPEISPLEWIYRQSFRSNNTPIWVYIIKSGVGPTIDGLFEPYFYLLLTEPQSYLSDFPSKLATSFNQVLG
ncbi:MAG: hypothetical protein KGD73_05200 [Candidatus Lokiarchaeota archaeon]|nr:hypothetical protein [Candidatus Lokiarchaeota archaeon]